MVQRVYVVTGAARGVGRAIAVQLAEAGHRVFGLDVAPAAGIVEGLTLLQADVADRASLEAARARVASEVDGLDGVLCVAGLFRGGPLVELPESHFRQLLDVNVLGVFLTNQVFFPLLHARKGRVVIMGSESGSLSGPFGGAYSTTKFALEGYADGLRRELALLGMPVILVQPGPVDTGLLDSNQAVFEAAADRSTWFEGALRKTARLVVGEKRKATSPDEVARRTVAALMARRAPIRVPIHQDRVRWGLSKLPARWVDRLFQAVLGSR